MNVQKQSIMKTIVPKDLYSILKIWICFCRFLCTAPFKFSSKNRIEILKLWRVITSSLNILVVLFLHFMNIFIKRQPHLENPFVLIGCGRKVLTSTVAILWMIENAQNVYLIAEILNGFLKINNSLPLNFKNRRILFSSIIFQIFSVISVIILNGYITSSGFLTTDDILEAMRKFASIYMHGIIPPMELHMINLIALIGLFFDTVNSELEKLATRKNHMFDMSPQILFLRYK